MNKICYGCGINLQTKDKEEKGYIPDVKKDSPYCMRCYKLIHYGKNSELIDVKKTEELINNINKDNIFTIFLTDYLSINKEVINTYKSIKGNKLFLISKYDLIKEEIKEYEILNTLKKSYEIKEDILFISSKENYKVKELLNYLKRNNINITYLVGATNSGKSSLINNLIDLTKTKINKTTTSKNINTTIDFIRVNLNGDLTVIDSPGFSLPEVTLTKKIKKIIYQMKKDEVLKIEEFYLKVSDNTSLILYLKDDIKINKHFKEVKFNDEIKLKDNDEIIINNYGIIKTKNKCNIKMHNILNYEIRNKHE